MDGTEPALAAAPLSIHLLRFAEMNPKHSTLVMFSSPIRGSICIAVGANYEIADRAGSVVLRSTEVPDSVKLPITSATNALVRPEKYRAEYAELAGTPPQAPEPFR